ncbi:RNA polymerase sigma factor, sigma-70 family [Bernardetia litoralis DSM 6794]|uniref:RNA polymerase sigma factor, sigma-70 family n=1 Tax=Bernardetia litoralis (strain ATCC 23117 / DSM 6794 / NBRC 15988 / NCIMB 1366 / Fx l1 / Sio-4) TaxID=880071 RepID=I4AN40_BERLS|nr:sigma-70 family RNA polymerase sigma factor [Bernardetia litoralis]AFM05375.1 RNA polymerase sigma factor, sigma-70 family [Bernardetia litoralis DSM 6794]
MKRTKKQLAYYDEQKQLLTEFCQGNEKAFSKLYHYYYGFVENYVCKNNGTTEDAQDVFQETLIVFLEKLKKDNFYLTASLKTYIIAISKNIWLNSLRKNKKTTIYSITNSENSDDSTDFNQKAIEIILSTDFDTDLENEKSILEKFNDYFSHLTSHCQNLLSTIVEEEKTTEEIQKEFGYTTRNNLHNQKYKCVNQLKKVKALAESKL